MTEAADPWQQWAHRRPPFRGTHLDSAAAGRQSTAVLQAVADHALREAQTGAYIAEADAAAVFDGGRDALAGLLGMDAEGVVFVDSAEAALNALLATWPLPDDASVAVTPSEWGPNLQAFARRGLRIRELATDAHGRVDLDALAHMLRADPPTLVHLTQVASHRPLVQPVAEVAALCHRAGLALWVDAAQALGHVDCATGASAVYSTSRKWLGGPRGVGVLGVAAPWRDALRAEAPVLDPDCSAIRRLQSGEAHVAGRVGLCAAVAEFVGTGPGCIWRRLDEVGRLTRAALAEVPGWQVLAAPPGSGAITALRPTAGQDVMATRTRLLQDHGMLTTAGQPARAPREMTEPLLRISPHVDCAETTLTTLARVLASIKV